MSAPRAMVLAAGLGTRLRPLTGDRPKALVEVAGQTMLARTLACLRACGITEVLINLHHHADQVAAYLEEHHNFGMHLTLSCENNLLDTGGGILHASWFFLEQPRTPFYVHNVDVLSTIPLDTLLHAHTQSGALATLAVQQRPTSRLLLFDQHGLLCGRQAGLAAPPELLHSPVLPGLGRPILAEQGWEPRVSPPPPTPTSASNTTTSGHPTRAPQAQEPPQPQTPITPWAFTGIHVLSPDIFPLLTEQGAFPIIPAYLRLAAAGHPIRGFYSNEYYWRDLGRPEHIRAAEADLHSGLIPSALSSYPTP